MKIFEMFFKHNLISDMYNSLLEFFTSRNGKNYQRIKEESDEDNNLFTQLLAKIYWSELDLNNQSDFLKMKTWFQLASEKARVNNNKYFSEILRFLPEKYLESQETELTSFVVLSPLFKTLNQLGDAERHSFIRYEFYDSLDEKSDPELAAQEYVNKNKLSKIDADKYFHSWANFCDKLPELLVDEKNKKRILTYKQSHEGRDLEIVIHDFVNDFMNVIANQIKMETGNDTTGKLLTEETPVFIWLKHWLQLDDEQKIVHAVGVLRSPQHFYDMLLNNIKNAKVKLKNLDEKLKRETTAENGLASMLNNFADKIKNKRLNNNG